MAKIGIGRVHIAWGVPWSRRSVIFKQGAPWTGNAAACSVFQLKQCVKLARAATAKYGTKGKMSYKGVSMPAVAALVAKEIAGSVGGKTAADRARAAHEMASTRIAVLEALITAKG